LKQPIWWTRCSLTKIENIIRPTILTKRQVQKQKNMPLDSLLCKMAIDNIHFLCCRLVHPTDAHGLRHDRICTRHSCASPRARWSNPQNGVHNQAATGCNGIVYMY
jgi:hypothetical protein